MLGAERERVQGQRVTRDAIRSSAVTVGTCVVVAIGYFLAARLGLGLLSELEGVAVFWPASGVAAGILIARGPNARMPVAIGVIVATIAANLMADRSVWASIAKSGCNASEVLLTAWLVERWFGHPFALDRLRRIIGFVAAAAVGTATAAVGGAAAMSWFHKTAPFLDIWRVWFLSDGLGILTIAPLLIGVASPVNNLPPRHELLEGIGALLVLAVATSYVFSMPSGSWLAFVPILVVFPALLWVAARCQWIFAAAAVFVVAITSVAETTSGLDRFGDSYLAINDRVHVAQLRCLLRRCVCSFWPRCSLRGAKRRLRSGWLLMELNLVPSTRTLAPDTSNATRVLPECTDTMRRLTL
jgi:integral membrane sensor domain MASE1